MSKVHSVVFHKSDGWTALKSLKWLDKWGYKPLKMHVSEDSFRFRIVDPKQFRSFSTKIIHTKHGMPISLVIGWSSPPPT